MLLHESGQYPYKAVDNIKVQTYWQLCEGIVREELKHKERADYGLYLINNLDLDLNIPKRDYASSSTEKKVQGFAINNKQECK